MADMQQINGEIANVGHDLYFHAPWHEEMKIEPSYVRYFVEKGDVASYLILNKEKTSVLVAVHRRATYYIAHTSTLNMAELQPIIDDCRLKINSQSPLHPTPSS